MIGVVSRELFCHLAPDSVPHWVKYFLIFASHFYHILAFKQIWFHFESSGNNSQIAYVYLNFDIQIVCLEIK